MQEDELNSNDSYCSKCSVCLVDKKELIKIKEEKKKIKCKHGKKRKYKKRKKKKVKTILTRRGYAIVKEHYGFRELHKAKKDLTVSPYINENVGGKAMPFPVYLESLKKRILRS